jgi:hypothetical protein
MSRNPPRQAGPGPTNDRSAQIMAIVVMISGQPRQLEEPVGCGFAAAHAANAEEWPSAEVRRRVFVPTVQLLREHLPQPEV